MASKSSSSSKVPFEMTAAKVMTIIVMVSAQGRSEMVAVGQDHLTSLKRDASYLNASEKFKGGRFLHMLH